jgi:hypothetical protein
MLGGIPSALSIREFIVWSRLWAFLAFMSLFSFSTVDSFTAMAVMGGRLYDRL